MQLHIGMGPRLSRQGHDYFYMVRAVLFGLKAGCCVHTVFQGRGMVCGGQDCLCVRGGALGGIALFEFQSLCSRAELR